MQLKIQQQPQIVSNAITYNIQDFQEVCSIPDYKNVSRAIA